ncbi:transglutaminase-like domain-containing protein [Pseudoroseicyclus tamaricis]|uniref:Transglutaminase domain-containing protein n=1 Tax=Pseudoroseicyclus tamaricis TaxID=2705421 RepID=A0A6B2JQH8_9RHOB|nr:transglutaminase-like domain-containing protein [Pseudoroseicyclus tamaricis]NDV00388.1 transglutaminase domain-containing protein [Pseudoroseicyclus tamaricis]
MIITRRTALKSGAAAAALAALPRAASALYAPQPSGWRTYEITTRVELPRASAPAQAWVPVPSLEAELWARPGETTFTTTAAEAELVDDPAQRIRFVHAVWEAGDEPAVLEVVSTISMQDRAVDLSSPTGATLSEAEEAHFTAATALLPTDGIVRDTAESIIGWAWTDKRKAERLYQWVVESTERDPEVRGCGLGDIASMLEMGNLSGKCADLNALYVGLARAAGLPARDLYGIRVAPSAFGYKSLGAGSADVSKAQHCRAEVFLENYGWVPTDPADVRKVVLEEPPKDLTLESPEVQDVRAALFGASEGNWIVYNDAHDVILPGSTQGMLPFLMYPQAEIDGVAQDELSPDSFTYTITARELT